MVWSCFLGKNSGTEEGLEHSIDVAARKKDMEISAFLMNERSRMLKEEQKVAGETENDGRPARRRKKFQL